jgi:hypothetical protein
MSAGSLAWFQRALNEFCVAWARIVLGLGPIGLGDQSLSASFGKIANISVATTQGIFQLENGAKRRTLHSPRGRPNWDCSSGRELSRVKRNKIEELIASGDDEAATGAISLLHETSRLRFEGNGPGLCR